MPSFRQQRNLKHSYEIPAKKKVEVKSGKFLDEFLTHRQYPINHMSTRIAFEIY
jgi:hypothetical protein